MSDQYGRRGKSAYHCGNTDGVPDTVFKERGWAIREWEAEAEMNIHEPVVQPRKVERQIKYRRIGEASLSRDTPTKMDSQPTVHEAT